MRSMYEYLMRRDNLSLEEALNNLNDAEKEIWFPTYRMWK